MNPNNLTQEQIKQGYSTIEGAFDPLTGKLKPSNVITPQSLQPQTPIQLPQTPEITTPQQPIVNMANPFLEELKLNEQEQKAQQFQTAGIDQLIRDTIALESEGQSRAEEFAKAGVSTLKQDLQGINSQILKKQAEVQQDDITLVANMRAEERRDTLLPFAEMGKAKLAGDAMIVRALKNAEIGVLNATALAKQGDIALAIQTAEEAVATKYAPYKARIERYDTIIKALDPYLSSAEKKEAQKQQFKGQMAMKEIEKVEENEKAIEKMLLDATPNAPANIIASANAVKQRGGSALEVAQALGKYGGDYLKTEMLKEQIKTEKAQQANIYNTISARNADTIRQDNAAKGINNGTLKQEDIAKAIESKVGVKTIAVKGLVSELENLKSLYAKYGARPVTAEGIGAIQSARSSAQLAITAAFGQGAISADDRTNYEKITGSSLSVNPTANLNQALETQKKNYTNNLNLLNTAYPGVDKLETFGGATTTTINPADNKFGQSLGVQAPVDYTTTNMSVGSDGALVWKLPTNNSTK